MDACMDASMHASMQVFVDYYFIDEQIRIKNKNEQNRELKK